MKTKLSFLEFLVFVFVLFYLLEHDAPIWIILLLAFGVMVSAILDYTRGP